MANIDQATVWLGILCEGHYVADVDRATVWHSKNSIESEAKSILRIQSNSMISQSFDAVMHLQPSECGPRI